MKILLVGEYSNLHNTLKKGLIAHGHEVFLVSSGDYFKRFNSDLLIRSPFKSGFFKKINSLFFYFLNIDFNVIYVVYKFKKHQKKLTHFDVVQLINQTPFDLYPKHEKKIFDQLKTSNNKVFVLGCGID